MAPRCCVKNVALGSGYGIHPSQSIASHKNHVVRLGRCVTFPDETTFVAPSCVDFFLDTTHTDLSVMLKFGIIQGSFGNFYTLTEFSRHFMCIIRIWTTGTSSSVQNWVEKNHMCVLGWICRSHARDGNEIQTPRPCWLPVKRWDAWFLNSSKSKTRLKFMKLGMLSWSGINMPC